MTAAGAQARRKSSAASTPTAWVRDSASPAIGVLAALLFLRA